MASIFLRNGVWQIKYKRAGRWFYRSLRTRDKRRALSMKRQAEAELRGEVDAPPTPPDQLCFEDLGRLYKEWAESHHRPQTRDNFARAIRKFPEVTGLGRIAEVTPRHIAAFKSARLKEVRLVGSEEKALSPRTVNETIEALRAVTEIAIREGWYVGGNPFRGFRALPLNEEPTRWLSSEEIPAVLEIARARGRDALLLFALGIYAGLRKNEIVNARWEWFDFEAGLIHVTMSGTFKTKTGKSRSLPMHAKLREILEDYRQPSGYLIAPEKEPGQYRYRFDVRKNFDGVMKAAGIQMRVHDLRHTFGSQLASAGVSLYKIGVWLGHTTTEMTKRYAQLQQRDEDINRF